MPDPGSDEARQLGCICPVLDNTGRVNGSPWWITAGCAVHAPRPPTRPAGRYTCDWKSTMKPCRNCKMSGEVEVRDWESDCGIFQGQQWRCSNCITAWWIDGPYG